jgi:hypothetical protein
MPVQQLTPDQIKELSEMDPTWRRFWAAVWQAPQNMQDFAFTEEAVERLREILEKRHGLNLQVEASEAARIIWDVFFGIIPLQSFVQELVDKVPLSLEQATQIAQEVNQAIFQPVRDSLMEVHQIAQSRAGELGTPPGGAHDPSEYPSPGTPSAAALHDARAAEAARRRAALLERLRAYEERERRAPEPPPAAMDTPAVAQYAPPADIPTPSEPASPMGSSAPNGNGPARARLTAWNGKTIDLSKIPPRRETNKKNGVPIEENGVRYVKLVKSKDGYWYEV